MDLAEHIATMFRARVRDMPQNNLRQADIPEGGERDPEPDRHRAGIALPDCGDKVVYAVPGVPYEMQLMVTDHVLPDLLRGRVRRSAIVSRSLKTWGTSESALAEMVAHRLDALDSHGNPTIAFLARGIEGLVCASPPRRATEAEARALVEAEEKELRAILGDLVFGVDDETMESRGARALAGAGLDARRRRVGDRRVDRRAHRQRARARATCSAARSVPYATDVKRSVLGVTAERGRERGGRAARWPKARNGCSAPTSASRSPASRARPSRTASPVGTVCFGIALPGVPTEAVSTRLPGDRERIRQFATISLLNLLRQRLDAL